MVSIHSAEDDAHVGAWMMAHTTSSYPWIGLSTQTCSNGCNGNWAAEYTWSDGTATDYRNPVWSQNDNAPTYGHYYRDGNWGTWCPSCKSEGVCRRGSLLNLMQPNDNVGGAIVRLSAVACDAPNSMRGSVEIDLGEYCTLAAGNGFGCGASGCFQARSSVTCWGGRLASTQGYPTNNSDGYPGEPVSYPDYRSLDM